MMAKQINKPSNEKELEKKAEAAKVEAAKVEAEKVEAAKVEAAKVEAEKVEAEKVEAEKAKFGTGFFFIEDGEFFKELRKKITDKKNIDDFSFVDSAMLPGKVRIMQRPEDWKIKTTSKRGDLKGKEGDFLLFDPNGNKLKVSGPMFRKLYSTLFGE